MILTKLNYCENEGTANYWKIDDLHFGMLNLIVALNATGKTRLVNVISNLAKILSKKISIKNGIWDLEFKTDTNEKYRYKLTIVNRQIKREEIKKGAKILLKRELDKGTIYSYKSQKKLSISPPKNELILQVRRDIQEFPYLEELFEWADSFLGYQFTNARPKTLLLLANEAEENLEDLGATPMLLERALKDKNITKAIIEDFTYIGYPINKVSVKPTLVSGIPNPVLMTSVQENDLECEIEQLIMSQGMYRAFSMIVILNYILNQQKKCTIVIDDVGEGLDFERSSALTKLLIKKLEGTEIQMIMTSNDRFLINTVPLRYINILERKSHIVKSYNYHNSKKIFDDFKYTGLNNFDLLSSKMFRPNEEDLG